MGAFHGAAGMYFLVLDADAPQVPVQPEPVPARLVTTHHPGRGRHPEALLGLGHRARPGTRRDRKTRQVLFFAWISTFWTKRFARAARMNATPRAVACLFGTLRMHSAHGTILVA